jgi:cell fate (sporulation/competence/biofilm development) regulator YlbF (YheA/YmcA/DUF963 family)
VPASSELDSLYETEDNVPAWVAASERYVEECQLRLQKLQPEQDPASADSDRQRNAQMLEATLQQIRDVVARVAKSEPRRRPQ